jgi:hypothetical protein
LKKAASEGYVRASYALGLVLRDSQPEDAMHYMKHAAAEGYIPALQELLSAREMKQKHGEPNAETLRLYLDPVCLNRLLSRYYVREAELRELSTSHCWNPLCGRWAFKATTSTSDSTTSQSPSNGGESGVSDPPSSSDFEKVPEPPKRLNHHLHFVASCPHVDQRVSRMKMCSRCCRAKYCSKLCQVYDWRSGRHKMECQFL